ncbi:hypothetical protein F383_24529 [Gossypium arboreum]|uniref:Uncharacterized protein n=1 Tax=Gossypium arboreum TaxID=29729 RepID=A0A0B0NZX6_GOSAR|nr:hypothetical protein F383_24529 [Gossypium arboreum]
MPLSFLDLTRLLYPSCLQLIMIIGMQVIS